MRYLVIFVAVLGLSGAVRAIDLVSTHDGQPGCYIRYEFTRLWRNNFDQHAFWRCERWGEGAVRHDCPPYTSFQDSWQTCLPDDHWEWTPYSDPPTRPDETELDQCDPIENPTPCPTNPPITTPEPDWNTTRTTPTPNWNTTTTDSGWNTTTPDSGWNTTTPDSGWNTTTPDYNTTTPYWNTTTPHENESSPDPTTTPSTNGTDPPCPTCPPVSTTTPSLNTTTEEPTTTPVPPFNTTTPIEDTDPTDPDCPTCPPSCPTCPPGTSTPQTPTPPDGDIIGVCPGAADHQYAPGEHDCNPPPCTWEQWLNGTLYPTRDPTKFFQCGPGEGNLYVMPCGAGTCFSFDEQVCVHIVDWVNPCTSA